MPRLTDRRRPPRLDPGSRIRVVAPAGPVDADRLGAACQVWRDWGYEVVLGRYALGRDGYLSGSDGERARDLDDAVRDPSTALVVAARGGYGTMRILPWMNWGLWRERPRGFLGFSDCTAVLAALHGHAGLIGFHGPVMQSGDWRGPSGTWCLRLLRGESGWLHPDPMTQVSGRSGEGLRGELVGGNLSLVAALLGTPWAWRLDRGAILYLEEVGEAPYRVDRLLTQLSLAGVFDRVAAVIFGQWWRSEAEGPLGGPTTEQVVVRCLARLPVPAYLGLPSGHGPFQVTLPMGAVVEVRERRLWLPEPAVS